MAAIGGGKKLRVRLRQRSCMRLLDGAPVAAADGIPPTYAEGADNCPDYALLMHCVGNRPVHGFL